jgi:galactonate dehydratase
MSQMRRRSMLKALAAAPLLAGSAAALAASAKERARHIVGDLQAWKLKVNHRGDWLVIRLRTESGLTGIGDASHGGDDRTIAYLRQFAGLLRGRSIFSVEWLRQATAPIIAASNDASAVVAASALEHCLWDLAGKALGVPTHALLGGALRDRIPLYANINRSTLPRTADAFAAMAKRAVDAGFRAVKLAPFDEMPADRSRTRDVAPLIADGIAKARAVRDAIGPEREVLIDAHSRFTLEEGLDLARRLEPLRLYWLEEVTPPEPLTDLAAINAAASMTTAGGEAIRGVAGFYPYIQARTVDIVMPDVKMCGGLFELKKIAALAEAAGLTVSPHGPASPVGNLAAGQVAATLPNFDILEFSFGEVPWRVDLLTPAEPLVDGGLQLSDRPGFGHGLNERFLAERGTPL